MKFGKSGKFFLILWGVLAMPAIGYAQNNPTFADVYGKYTAMSRGCAKLDVNQNSESYRLIVHNLCNYPIKTSIFINGKKVIQSYHDKFDIKKFSSDEPLRYTSLKTQPHTQIKAEFYRNNESYAFYSDEKELR